jgi:hypothetical protein
MLSAIAREVIERGMHNDAERESNAPDHLTSSPHARKEPFGLLWTWWQGDEQPEYPALKGLSIQQSNDRNLMRRYMMLTPADITHRLKEGHRVYLATIDDTIVAYGWSAIGKAAFGSPTVLFQVPTGNRYLYHFVTLPPWRGQGIYPRLLQNIIEHESNKSERFWIIHQQRNTASRRGIASAGFHIAGQISGTQYEKYVIGGEDEQRAQAGATLLKLPLHHTYE